LSCIIEKIHLTVAECLGLAVGIPPPALSLGIQGIQKALTENAKIICHVDLMPATVWNYDRCRPELVQPSVLPAAKQANDGGQYSKWALTV